MIPARIRIVNFGKVEREYREIINFYISRISKISRLKIEEGKYIKEEYVVLDPSGREVNGEEFYRMIGEYSRNGKEIVFVIGPPAGFEKENIKNNVKISLSKLTMRHELAYLVLLEQIYRALLKLKGVSYEK